jgi:hypothetical protein
MPIWVIVASDSDGEPVVVREWVMGLQYASIDRVKRGEETAVTFRDRWRAKRQAKLLPRALHARCIRLDRL